MCFIWNQLMPERYNPICKCYVNYVSLLFLCLFVPSIFSKRTLQQPNTPARVQNKIHQMTNDSPIFNIFKEMCFFLDSTNLSTVKSWQVDVDHPKSNQPPTQINQTHQRHIHAMLNSFNTFNPCSLLILAMSSRDNAQNTLQHENISILF